MSDVSAMKPLARDKKQTILDFAQPYWTARGRPEVGCAPRVLVVEWGVLVCEMSLLFNYIRFWRLESSALGDETYSKCWQSMIVYRCSTKPINWLHQSCACFVWGRLAVIRNTRSHYLPLNYRQLPSTTVSYRQLYRQLIIQVCPK